MDGPRSHASGANESCDRVESRSVTGYRADRRATFRALIIVTFGLALAVTLSADAGASVRTSATPHANPELLKTIPIAKRPFDSPRSVLSIPPNKLGALADGDTISGMGEAEITICLKADPSVPGDGQPCVGNIYDYNPVLKARLVLAGGKRDGNPAGTLPISRTKTLTCHQNHPVRNHHCVIAVPWSSWKVDTSKLPCRPAACHMNMVVSAHHPASRSGELVVVGSSDDNRRIHQGLGKLSAVRHRGSSRAKRWRGGRVTKKAPVVSRRASIDKRVIYSARVSNLRAGDQLVVDAQARIGIGHLPYNVFQRSEVVLAKSKHSIKQFGKIADSTARISASNGLNCTQGRSGHSDTCTIRKGGILSVKKRARGPLYVNFVVGQHAIGVGYQKWRSGDSSKIGKRGGFVRVSRYHGQGSCQTCPTGWVSFSADRQPSSARPAKLVKQITAFGITEGRYNCKGRRGGPSSYICNWEASGRVGSSPRYECTIKAWWRAKHKRFDMPGCKDFIGAKLWDRLGRLPIPVAPTFAGACKPLASGNYRCRWYGHGAVGALLGKYCKGEATYFVRTHAWSIDRCTNPNA